MEFYWGRGMGWCLLQPPPIEIAPWDSFHDYMIDGGSPSPASASIAFLARACLMLATLFKMLTQT
jgi:hypothetical protein